MTASKESTDATDVMSVVSPKWRAFKRITLVAMHVYLCPAKQYLYFIWPVSLDTLCRLRYGMEITTYILYRPIREASRRSVAVGTSLQHRVSLVEKGADYRSYKQAVCA